MRCLRLQVLIVEITPFLRDPQRDFASILFRCPHYFWFLLSGLLCDFAQAGIEFIVYGLYPSELSYKTGACWGISYSLSIIVRHFSHRYLVFGEYEGSYFTSLARTYMTYSSSIVISIITNQLMVEYLLLTHWVAWLVTLLWTGIYNYFMLKSTWKGKKQDDHINDYTADKSGHTNA